MNAEQSGLRTIALAPVTPEGANTLDMTVPAYLFLDAGRTGDLTRDHLNDWSERRGAVISFNPSPDSRDTRHLAPLELRRGDSQVQGEITGKLELLDPDANGQVLSAERDPKGYLSRVSIWRDKARSQRVLGDGRAECILPIPETGLTLWMEATRFRLNLKESEFVCLRFTPCMGQKESPPQFGKIRIAPWLMCHDLDKPQKVHCADWCNKEGKDNVQFRRELTGACAYPLETSHFQVRDGPRFVQDAVKFGYSVVPGEQSISVPAALVSPEHRWNGVFAGFRERLPCFAVRGCEISPDSVMGFGNLQVTPPTLTYPFGRIYYSADHGVDKGKFSKPLIEFLAAQEYQCPFTLDASWLYVGHVDEVVTFLQPRARTQLVAVIPSPRIAVALLMLTNLIGAEAKMHHGELLLKTFLQPESRSDQSQLEGLGMSRWWEDHFGAEWGTMLGQMIRVLRIPQPRQKGRPEDFEQDFQAFQQRFKTANHRQLFDDIVKCFMEPGRSSIAFNSTEPGLVR